MEGLGIQPEGPQVPEPVGRHLETWSLALTKGRDPSICPSCYSLSIMRVSCTHMGRYPGGMGLPLKVWGCGVQVRCS